MYTDTHILTRHTFAFLSLRIEFNYIGASFNLDAFPVVGYNLYTVF